MNKKIAEVRIFVEGCVDKFETYEREHDDPLSAGHLQAQLARFKRLWRIGFYIDPAVKEEKGPEFSRQLKEAIRVLVLGKYPRDERVDTLTARIAGDVVCIPEFHLYGHTPLATPSENHGNPGGGREGELYPTQAISLRAFIAAPVEPTHETAEQEASRVEKPGPIAIPHDQGQAPLDAQLPGRGETIPSRGPEIPGLTLEEIKLAFGTYVQQNVAKGKEAQVWRHVGRRIQDTNKQGGEKITRVRNALVELKLTLPPKEEFFGNRFEPEAIAASLDRVFES